MRLDAEIGNLKNTESEARKALKEIEAKILKLEALEEEVDGAKGIVAHVIERLREVAPNRVEDFKADIITLFGTVNNEVHKRAAKGERLTPNISIANDGNDLVLSFVGIPDAVVVSCLLGAAKDCERAFKLIPGTVHHYIAEPLTIGASVNRLEAYLMDICKTNYFTYNWVTADT